MTQAVRLNQNQKHLLRLIADGIDESGYAPISTAVYPVLEGVKMPHVLIEMEQNADGSGRARLTVTGQNLIEAMKWL